MATAATVIRVINHHQETMEIQETHEVAINRLQEMMEIQEVHAAVTNLQAETVADQVELTDHLQIPVVEVVLQHLQDQGPVQVPVDPDAQDN